MILIYLEWRHPWSLSTRCWETFKSWTACHCGFGAWLSWRWRYCQIALKQFPDMAFPKFVWASQQDCFVLQQSSLCGRRKAPIIKHSPRYTMILVSVKFSNHTEAEESLVFLCECWYSFEGVITSAELHSQNVRKNLQLMVPPIRLVFFHQVHGFSCSLCSPRFKALSVWARHELKIFLFFSVAFKDVMTMIIKLCF